MTLLDGKKVAKEIQNKLQVKIDSLPVKPGLCVIMVGSNPESLIYVNMKLKKCQEMNINNLIIDNYTIGNATKEYDYNFIQVADYYQAILTCRNCQFTNIVSLIGPGEPELLLSLSIGVGGNLILPPSLG